VTGWRDADEQWLAAQGAVLTSVLPGDEQPWQYARRLIDESRAAQAAQEARVEMETALQAGTQAVAARAPVVTNATAAADAEVSAEQLMAEAMDEAEASMAGPGWSLQLMSQEQLEVTLDTAWVPSLAAGLETPEGGADGSCDLSRPPTAPEPSQAPITAAPAPHGATAEPELAYMQAMIDIFTARASESYAALARASIHHEAVTAFLDGEGHDN